MKLKLSYRPFRVKMADLNISRKEIEAATGINKNTIGRLYNDIDVSIDTVRKVCEYFDCKIQDIVEFIPEGVTVIERYEHLTDATKELIEQRIRESNNRK